VRDANAERGEAREVDARREQRAVLPHPFAAAHASAAPAVLAPHQMTDLALDPGPHLPVLLLPRLVALTLAVTIERRVLRVQPDRAT
jgi:hypothetical protein